MLACPGLGKSSRGAYTTQSDVRFRRDFSHVALVVKRRLVDAKSNPFGPSLLLVHHLQHKERCQLTQERWQAPSSMRKCTLWHMNRRPGDDMAHFGAKLWFQELQSESIKELQREPALLLVCTRRVQEAASSQHSVSEKRTSTGSQSNRHSS